MNPKNVNNSSPIISLRAYQLTAKKDQNMIIHEHKTAPQTYPQAPANRSFAKGFCWYPLGFNGRCKEAIWLKKRLKESKCEFETEAQTVERREKTIRALKRCHVSLNLDSAAVKRLTKKLERCDWPNDPCCSMACDVCMMDLRLWHGTQVEKILRCHDLSNIKWVTIIPPYEKHKLGKLAEFDCAEYTRYMRRRLKELIPDAVVLGGADFSFNVDGASDGAKYWQPHAHLIVVGYTDKDELKVRLRPFYNAPQKKPKDGSVSQKPSKAFLCKVMDVDNICGLITYSLKSQYKRKFKKANTITNTKPRDGLTFEMRAELALYLNRLEYDDRMIFRHVSRRENKDRLVCKKKFVTCSKF